MLLDTNVFSQLDGVICGSSANGELIPKNKLNYFLNGLKEHETKVLGVYSLKGQLNTNLEKFTKLYQDDRILITDVTEKMVEDQIENSGTLKIQIQMLK